MVRNLHLSLTNMLMFCFSMTAFSCNNQPSQNVADTQSNHQTMTHIRTPSESANDDSATRNLEWPCFHGSDRSNKSSETGLLKSWPEGGPELLFTVSGLGEGYATVSIADGMIFTSGTIDNQVYVLAFDLSGKPLWKQTNGRAWQVEVSWASGYNGPRSTPTYDNGVVYHQSELNKLTAYNAKTGEVIWSKDLLAEFEASIPEYGFTESVLVEGDNLYVKPGGKKGYHACLDKNTGATIWVNRDIQGEYGYSSSVFHNLGGYRLLISASSVGYYGIDSKTGKLLWTADFKNTHDVKCADAIAFDEYVFMSIGVGGGSKLIKLNTGRQPFTPETVWHTELMDNYHGGVIYHDGYFYGAGDRSRGWFALDGKTGAQMWKFPNSQGSLTWADGMLYLLEEKGTMKLVKSVPESFQSSGEFVVPKGNTKPYWAHPVVCGGRLYIRHGDKLFVYNIQEKQ